MRFMTYLRCFVLLVYHTLSGEDLRWPESGMALENLFNDEYLKKGSICFKNEVWPINDRNSF